MKEELLVPGPTESIYQGRDGEQHNQFQDYCMYQMRNGKVHALYALENQNKVDSLMPLRHAGYEGAAYRSQYQSETNRDIYPVISVVLNWSEKPWRAAPTIGELLEAPVPDAAEGSLSRLAGS